MICRRGESVPLSELEGESSPEEKRSFDQLDTSGTRSSEQSTREVLVTDGERHSIPLNEILSGGPPKDGIPSIDNPEFITPADADEWLDDSEIGLGLTINGESRFYPYQILVFHEIVNDMFGDTPALVTYCPLCATGVVFDPVVDGTRYEFGVSGLLWQSNLLMYNRTDNPDDETLWSQVLGEAVLGPLTGKRLNIISADTVRYGEWKEANPDTVVLSRNTGALRSYGRDPYGDYYTDNNAVGFGATFDDGRLAAKQYVLGIEINGMTKAYLESALEVGTTEDTFAGERIVIERTENQEIRMFVGETREPLPYIGGFWFSWAAVHPDTEVYK